MGGRRSRGDVGLDGEASGGHLFALAPSQRAARATSRYLAIRSQTFVDHVLSEAAGARGDVEPAPATPASSPRRWSAHDARAAAPAGNAPELPSGVFEGATRSPGRDPENPVRPMEHGKRKCRNSCRGFGSEGPAHNLIDGVDKGNSFAVWQEPDFFTTEIRRRRRAGGVMSTTITEIPSFQIEIPQEQLDDLRRRIAATRWPTKELIGDRSQGCSWRRCRSSPTTGRPSTTGASARRD